MILKKISVLSFLLGFGAIIAQALILRVFQTVFYGNELSYAVMLSSWLFWVGAGSLMTSMLLGTDPAFSQEGKKVGSVPTILTALYCGLALCIPSTVFGIRYIKPILDIGSGQLISIVPMVVSGFALTAPIGFFIGSVFVVLCDMANASGASAGKVYFFESWGSAIGGVVFSFILLRFFDMTVIACLASVMILLSLLFDGQPLKIKKVVCVLLGLMLMLTGVAVFYHLDFASHQKQYPFKQLVAVEDSPYGNIAVVKQQGQYSVYQNGLLSFTIGDLLSAEENVHFPLLAHPFPQKVLLIGNGLGGEINEILKYPDMDCDYVEIDTRFIDIVRSFLSEATAAALHDPRLSFFPVDARRFVKSTSREYDVVIVNVGDPYTAGLNRYYTLEFLEELDRILAIGGIVSFRVSSSENFLSQENRDFLRSLLTTMKNVFPDVRSIPGDTHTFLASNIKGRINVNPAWLQGRYLGAGIKNKFLNEHTLPFRVVERRIAGVEQILAKKDGVINTDLFPRAYLFQTLLWSTHFDLGMKKLAAMIKVPFWKVTCGVIIFLLIIGLVKIRKSRFGAIELALATTGFSEIVFEIVVILAFQSLYGIAYQQIGLILASFMMGLLVGAKIGTDPIFIPKNMTRHYFNVLQGLIVVYPLLLPLFFRLFRDSNLPATGGGFFIVLFASLPFIAGFFGGIQYPLAVRILGSDEAKGVGAAGKLYAFDAFGAAAGALLTGIFFIPLYGIAAVCVLCAVINLVVLIFLMCSRALEH